jgi:hypothetical protein
LLAITEVYLSLRIAVTGKRPPRFTFQAERLMEEIIARNLVLGLFSQRCELRRDHRNLVPGEGIVRPILRDIYAHSII